MKQITATVLQSTNTAVFQVLNLLLKIVQTGLTDFLRTAERFR